MIFVETNRLFLRKVEEGDWPYFRVHLTDREKDRMIRILLSTKLGEMKWSQADLARATGIRPNTDRKSVV